MVCQIQREKAFHCGRIKMIFVAPATFECDELVVGATLQAVDFATENNLPLLTNGKVVYFSHEVSPEGQRLQDVVANKKIKLAVKGKLVFPSIDSIYLRNNYLSLISRTSSQKLYFKKLFLFDAEEIENIKRTVNYYEIVDILKKRYLLTTDNKRIVTKEKFFVTEIIFGKQNLLYIKSKLTAKQLSGHEHTEFMARRKVGWWLKTNGYKSHVKGNITKLYHHKRLKRAHYHLNLPDNIVDKTNG